MASIRESWRYLTLSTLLSPLARPTRAGDLARRLATEVLPERLAGRLPDTAHAASAHDARALGGTPSLVGGARAVQRDATTCGSAVLVHLAALGDPELARWIEDGTVPASPRPEVPDAAGRLDLVGAGMELTDPDRRFDAAQRVVKSATSRHAIGPVGWPEGLGTPPWTAARQARFPGVTYRVAPVDDRTARGAAVLAWGAGCGSPSRGTSSSPCRRRPTTTPGRPVRRRTRARRASRSTSRRAASRTWWRSPTCSPAPRR
jgi:hypothetical protein